MGRSIWNSLFSSLLVATTLVVPVLAVSEEAATVSGHLVDNGETVELPYVYAYVEKEGFYDPSDPAWRVIFSAEEIAPRDLDNSFFEFPYIIFAFTLVSDFDDEPALEIYSQNLQLPSRNGAISGGADPLFEIESTGPDRFAGRLWLDEMVEFFGDTYQYDLTFSAPFSDINAPIGDPLPAGGGEPGAAYIAWTKAIRSMDIGALKSMVPQEQAEMLDAPEAQENLEFMQAMTPADIEIAGGSSDGTMALLEVRGTVDGRGVQGEITLEKMDALWVLTNENWIATDE